MLLPLQEGAGGRPPLEAGCVLRLRPPKTADVVEVTLDSGRKLLDFPESPSPSGSSQGGQQRQQAACWEGLEAPPASAYLFEQLLQRVAADVPPELLALVEERRERGREALAARDQLRREMLGGRVGGQAGCSVQVPRQALVLTCGVSRTSGQSILRSWFVDFICRCGGCL